MKRKIGAATAMLLLSVFGTANAAPVYLECEIDNPGGADAASKVLHYKIALDEGTKTAELQYELTFGKAVSLSAQFMQTEVAFST